jgi:hypothetical protein
VPSSQLDNRSIAQGGAYEAKLLLEVEGRHSCSWNLMLRSSSGGYRTGGQIISRSSEDVICAVEGAKASLMNGVEKVTYDGEMWRWGDGVVRPRWAEFCTGTKEANQEL